MSERIRWGILGAGNIAHQFAEGLKSAQGAELRAVGSRSRENAERFGELFDIPHRHASYAALAADPEVDVVYVATPHPMHKDNAMLCLEAGKAVLCEKPFTVNQSEARVAVDCARRNKCFLMEAMWTRFLPVLEKTRAWLREGVIGEPLMVRADFGFRADYNEDGRLFLPELAGGGLLDVGIYPISLAAMVLGVHPVEVTSLAVLGASGVDEQNSVVFKYGSGAMAATTSALRVTTPQDAHILGAEGSIYLHSPFWRGDTATLSLSGREAEVFHFPMEGNGYNYQANAVMECLRAGKTECEVMSLDDSIAIMGILDAARAQWGLRYPME